MTAVMSRIMSISCLFIAIIAASCSRTVDITQVPFNSQTWKAYSFDHIPSALIPTDRQRMMRDLINNVLPGKSGPQIILLLGPGESLNDRRETWKKMFNEQYQGEWTYSYDIGNELLRYKWDGDRDLEELHIYLDNAGIFKYWEIVSSYPWPDTIGAPGIRYLYRARR